MKHRCLITENIEWLKRQEMRSRNDKLEIAKRALEDIKKNVEKILPEGVRNMSSVWNMSDRALNEIEGEG